MIETIVTAILGSVVSIVFVGLVKVLNKQTVSLNKIGGSLELLAVNVAYCPLNKQNKDNIKKGEL